MEISLSGNCCCGGDGGARTVFLSLTQDSAKGGHVGREGFTCVIVVSISHATGVSPSRKCLCGVALPPPAPPGSRARAEWTE